MWCWTCCQTFANLIRHKQSYHRFCLNVILLSLTHSFRVSFIWFWHVNKTCGFHLDFSGLLRTLSKRFIVDIYFTNGEIFMWLCWMRFWFMSCWKCTQTRHRNFRSHSSGVVVANGFKLHKLIKNQVVFLLHATAVDVPTAKHHSSFPHIKISILLICCSHSLANPQNTPPYGFCLLAMHSVVVVVCTISRFLLSSYRKIPFPITQFAIIYAAVEF